MPMICAIHGISGKSDRNAITSNNQLKLKRYPSTQRGCKVIRVRAIVLQTSSNKKHAKQSENMLLNTLSAKPSYTKVDKVKIQYVLLRLRGPIPWVREFVRTWILFPKSVYNVNKSMMLSYCTTNKQTVSNVTVVAPYWCKITIETQRNLRTTKNESYPRNKQSNSGHHANSSCTNSQSNHSKELHNTPTLMMNVATLATELC
jgi:hypothetical protein